MKLNLIRISNVLSFGYHENIQNATTLSLDDSINILIGQNGSGKSTMLEVINFICKRVLFQYWQRNDLNFARLNQLHAHERRKIIFLQDSTQIGPFRLDANVQHEQQQQTIQASITLDAIDEANIALLHTHKAALAAVAQQLTSNTELTQTDFSVFSPALQVTATMNNHGKARQEHVFEAAPDPLNPSGYVYLQHYHFFQALIYFHNLQHPDAVIPELTDTFTMIGGYRNYTAFSAGIEFRDQTPIQQLQGVRGSAWNQSLNMPEHSEPQIFNIVRILVAKLHFDRATQFTGQTGPQLEEMANTQPFMVKLNEKLQLIDLRARVRLTNPITWTYNFELHDLRNGRVLQDINQLSAGQKSIMHLIFEVYGRGALQGGVTVIDEPELHLHYQFQAEYLRILTEIYREQQVQYVIVTHSESLINTDTIRWVKRFALDDQRQTQIFSPTLTVEQRMQVKILDNTRSIHAFFARKVLLVEGDTDRYLFRALLLKTYPKSSQEIAVLSMGGKEVTLRGEGYLKIMDCRSIM